MPQTLQPPGIVPAVKKVLSVSHRIELLTGPCVRFFVRCALHPAIRADF